MAPNPTAQKNHEQLFPGHVSTLASTDPELIEYFDNFAFDEVLRDGKLDARARLMAQLAEAASRRPWATSPPTSGSATTGAS